MPYEPFLLGVGVVSNLLRGDLLQALRSNCLQEGACHTTLNRGDGLRKGIYVGLVLIRFGSGFSSFLLADGSGLLGCVVRIFLPLGGELFTTTGADALARGTGANQCWK